MSSVTCCAPATHARLSLSHPTPKARISAKCPSTSPISVHHQVNGKWAPYQTSIVTLNEEVKSRGNNSASFHSQTQAANDGSTLALAHQATGFSTFFLPPLSAHSRPAAPRGSVSALTCRPTQALKNNRAAVACRSLHSVR